MELFIILIILFFVWRHLKNKKRNPEENFTAPPSTTDVKQVKQFHEELKKQKE